MSVITCFGEVLWDVFPNYSRIGGAPLNVALRLASLGNRVWMISRVGCDEPGAQIVEHLEAHDLSTGLIQTDSSLTTGKVEVELDGSGTASYIIGKPVAWDSIAWNKETEDKVKGSDLLVFGSLASRSETSLNTLRKLLHAAKKKVFDVNLRPPHYRVPVIKELAQAADLVKMNEEELELILSFFGIGHDKPESAMRKLKQALPKHPDLCLTRGGHGALLLYEGKFYENKGFKVKVVDTVGAGDSFLAMLIHQLWANTPPQQALDLACAMGSAVAAKFGATDIVTGSELKAILNTA